MSPWRCRRSRRRRRRPAEIQAALDAAYAKYKNLKEGANADYIPALAKVDSKIYGIALVTADGKVYTAGDIKSEVSIQSISKVFTMAKVIEEQGPRRHRRHHRRRRHRHALQLDRLHRVLAEAARRTRDERPRQPGRHRRHQHGQGRRRRDEIWKSILGFYSDFAGRPLSVDEEVFKSEADTNQRNQAIGYADVRLRLHQDQSPMQATDIYTEQCSVAVNAKDLAMMAATLANGGKNPVTGKQVMKPRLRSRTCSR